MPRPRRPALCTQPGCTHPHRARGLCSTHYNQAHQPLRHAAHATTCTVCGTPIQRPTDNRRRHTCSTTCRRTLTFGPGSGQEGRYSWAADAVQRAREAGAAVVDVFDRLTVFDRDGWACYLCGRATDPEASPFDPASPTVDHVVPLSKGGEHSLANARTACLHCNSAKQALMITSQALDDVTSVLHGVIDKPS